MKSSIKKGYDVRNAGLYAAVCLLIVLTISAKPALSVDYLDDQVILSAPDNGLDIAVTAGKTIVVQLSAQAGIGFAWRFSENRSQLGALSFNATDHAIVRRPDEDGIPMLMQRFYFASQKAGKGFLVFELVQSWAKNAPVSHYTVTINVVN